jgi:hypothetical protein
MTTNIFKLYGKLKCSNALDLRNNISIYDAGFISYLMVLCPCSNMALFIMSVGFVLGVVVSFTTIALYTKLAKMAYTLCVCLTIFIPIMIKWTLPFSVGKLTYGLILFIKNIELINSLRIGHHD